MIALQFLRETMVLTIVVDVICMVCTPSKDYGFLDTSSNNVAYDMVAQQLLGKRRIVEGVGSGRLMSEVDRKKTMDELQKTTIEEDEKLLEGETNPSLVAAYNFRIGVKTALAKHGSD